MRRRNGTGLTANERRVLAAALKLHAEGEDTLYGYELFAKLCDWEGEAPMNHGTLYRCLRSLEQRGAFTSSTEQVGERLRVMYRLTPDGVALAIEATDALITLAQRPSWINSVDDLGLPPRTG